MDKKVVESMHIRNIDNTNKPEYWVSIFRTDKSHSYTVSRKRALQLIDTVKSNPIFVEKFDLYRDISAIEIEYINSEIWPHVKGD